MKSLVSVYLAIATCVSLLAVAPQPVVAATHPAKAATHRPVTMTRVVMQVSDNDPGKWNLALNNAENIQSALGKAHATIEIVAYGPGIDMLKMDSTVANRIADALKNGIKIVACQHTMRSMKLKPADMLPNIGYVPSGVIELIQKQEQGYAYIRP